MAQNPIFELEFEETVSGFAISRVLPDPNPQCVVNEGAPADSPRVIIRDNQPWDVNFRWRTSGDVAELLVADWTLEVHLMHLNGGGTPHDFSKKKVVKHVPTNPHDFKEKIEVAAGKVKDGLYKLYANVDITVPGAAKARITGFGEGPMMEFYTPQ